MPTEWLEWGLFGLAPFLAVFVALRVYNGIFGVRKRDQDREHDHWRNQDYQSWSEWVKAKGGIKPVFCSRFSGTADPCFAFEQGVSLYEPLSPCPYVGSVEDPLYDTARGMPVGEGWSVADCFSDVRFVGRGSFVLTEKEILFKGVSNDVKIPVREIHTVVAACSSLLVIAASSETPFLFGDVNGQKMRDIILYLLEE